MIVDIHGHRFEIFTLVSEIHDNVDLVMGMKNIFELEGVIDSRDVSVFLAGQFHFPSDNSRNHTSITKDGHYRSSFH